MIERGNHRATVLVLALLLPLAWLMSGDPIPQDTAYHVFADARTCLGIPYFLNVASNLAFLATGVAGLRVVLDKKEPRSPAFLEHIFCRRRARFGRFLYYHAAPGNSSLVWDRLPMTIAFMGLFSGLITECMRLRQERLVLAAAVATGVASIVWWHHSNDLRFYVWVQLAPFLAILTLLAVFPATNKDRLYLATGFALYAIAKVAEHYDREIFVLTRLWMSGHTLKHLLAAMAVLCICLMLRARHRT